MNTMKFFTNQSKTEFVYKIVDFDWAFKIFKPRDELYSSLYNTTIAIIKLWL